MAQDRRARLMDRIEGTWNDLLASFAGLSDAQMVAPGVVEEWSVKDLLAHVTTWEEETLKHLPEIARGEKQQRYSTLYGGIDAFNAMKSAENRQRSLAEVRSRLTQTHQRLLDYLATAPDDLLDSRHRFRTRLRWDTYGHYPIHSAHVSEWRARVGNEP